MVMGLALLVTAPWLGWGMAASAGEAALLVGMLDLRQNPLDRLRTMAVGTAMLTVTTLVARELSPWPLTVVAVLTLIAFGEGAGIAVHRDAPVLLQLNGIVAATALLEPQPRMHAWQAALVVLLAGGTQTLVSALFATRRHVIREVEIAASAMDDVGAFLRAVATSFTPDADRLHGVATADAMERAIGSLSTAQSAIDASDLASSPLMLLRRALFAADQLRVEGQALILRPLGPTPADTGSAVRTGRLSLVADLLHHGALALGHRVGKPDPEAARFRATLAEFSAGSAPAYDDPARTFAAAVQALLEAEKWPRTRPSTRDERHRRIQAALRPRGLPFRFGIRIAIASLAAGLVGYAGDLTHASWSINACLSVLRPDGGGLLTRFVLRATATAAAAAGVVLEAVLVGGNRATLASWRSLSPTSCSRSGPPTTASTA